MTQTQAASPRVVRIRAATAGDNRAKHLHRRRHIPSPPIGVTPAPERAAKGLPRLHFMQMLANRRHSRRRQQLHKTLLTGGFRSSKSVLRRGSLFVPLSHKRARN